MIQKRKLQVSFLLILLLGLLSGSLAACSEKSSGAEPFSMAPMDGMPAEVKDSPLAVRQAYQFAVANPDVLEGLPCYCGCGAMGHTSNYACYVSGADAAGAIQYDTHALGCSICVDITQDAMRLLRQGKALSEIRTYVDDTYAQYGPSNIP